MNLILGDCLEEMAKLPDKSIDLVLTDPPYGTTACKWDSVIPFEPMWAQLKRITKDNAAICLFGSEPFSSALRMSNIKMFKYDWYWNKKFAANFVQSSRMPLKTIESVLVFSQPTHPMYFPIIETRVSQIKIGGNGGIAIPIIGPKRGTLKGKTYNTKQPQTLLNFNCREGRGFHPTQKPVALLEYLIKTYTLEGETVLDFTMGSGSTGVAAKNLKRHFIGIEKELKYFEIAKRRIEQ